MLSGFCGEKYYFRGARAGQWVRGRNLIKHARGLPRRYSCWQLLTLHQLRVLRSFIQNFSLCYEHSERARVPHTHEPRVVPWCGALSLLQNPLHYMGIQQSSYQAIVLWALAQLLPALTLWLTRLPGQKSARKVSITPGSRSKSITQGSSCRPGPRGKGR